MSVHIDNSKIKFSVFSLRAPNQIWTMNLVSNQTQHFSCLPTAHRFLCRLLENILLKESISPHFEFCLNGPWSTKSVPQLAEMELLFLSQQHTLVKVVCFLSHTVNFYEREKEMDGQGWQEEEGWQKERRDLQRKMK